MRSHRLTRRTKLIALIVSSAFAATAPLAGGPTRSSAAQSPAATDSGWPRRFQSEGYAISLYQPQLESWNAATTLAARAAVALKAAGAQNPTFGVVWLSAGTAVDKDDRTVSLENITVTKVSFPSAAPASLRVSAGASGRGPDAG